MSRYRWTSRAIAIAASCSANWRPMHERSPGAERLEQRGGSGLGDRSGENRVGIEELDVVAPLRLTVQRAGEHRDGLTLLDGILPTDDGVRQRHPVEVQHRRGQSQRLADHLAQIRELADVVVGRQVVVVGSEHVVHLGSDAGQHRRVMHQVVDGVGHQLRRRQLPGDQERHDLVADVVPVESGCTVGIVRRA